MGILATPEIIECSITDLAGDYLGHTRLSVLDFLARALGKIILIDKAHLLVENYPFSNEVVAEIVGAMTNPRFGHNMFITLAGYGQGIYLLLASNPGLQSRFKRVMTFDSLIGEHVTDCLFRHSKVKVSWTRRWSGCWNMKYTKNYAISSRRCRRGAVFPPSIWPKHYCCLQSSSPHSGQHSRRLLHQHSHLSRIFSSLNSFPGPFGCSITSLSLPVILRHSDAFRRVQSLHQQYGTFVRPRPNYLSIAHSKAVNVIYGPGSRCTKAD